MPVSPASSRPLSPSSPKSVVAEEAVCLALQSFLDDWHYRIIHSSVGRKWGRKQVLVVLIRVLILNGVEIDEGDVDKLTTMEEKNLVRWLVDQMPQSTRENFDHLAMQMQLVVTTVARARKVLEDNKPDEVRKTIEEMDGDAVGQMILKQAIVSATKDVAKSHSLLETWMADTDARIGRLFSAAQVAEQCTQQLLSIESQLDTLGGTSKSKGKSMLLGLADKNDKQLMKSVFTGWLANNIAEKAENDIRRKFEHAIEEKEKLYFNCKERSLGNLRANLARSADNDIMGYLQTVIQFWKADVEAGKRDGGTRADIEALEAKLKASKDAMNGNALGFLARMSDNRDQVAVTVAMQAWIQVVSDKKRGAEFDEATKKAEASFKELMNSKKDGAMKVMERMSVATDSGLLSSCFQGWYVHINDDKKARELEGAMNKSSNCMKGLADRQKSNATGVQTRVNEMAKANLLLQCISLWYMESKVNHVERYYGGKIDGKRKQLDSVKSLFKSFAKQIEEGLGNIDRDGDSSGTRYTKSVAKSKTSEKTMKKGNPATTSLPDIRAYPGA